MKYENIYNEDINFGKRFTFEFDEENRENSSGAKRYD